MRKSIKLKEGENNSESPAKEKEAQHPDQTKGEQETGTTTVAIVQGEQPSAQVIPNAGQAPPINEEKALVVHTSEEKIPNSTIINSITNSSEVYMPEQPNVTGMLSNDLDQYTEHLSKTTSSIFSPTPLREPTPPIDESKGKGIATEEPLKDIIPFIEERGSVPNISSLKSFITPEGPLSQKKIIAQQMEMKRLADLKAKKAKSEKLLKKILNPSTIRAQTQKMAKHEAKRQKMLDEYNYQISFRANQLPITKINYVVNPNKEATMNITRGDNPLNLVVHPNFRLKTLGFCEWLEAKKLGLPPPPALATFGITAEDKKRKRIEIL
ncbi:hypothetical protein Tco_1484188 [Tanacetum coccineum]